MGMPIATLLCCWLPFLSSEPGVLTYAVTNLLRQLFGYSAYLLPLFLMIIGERLLVTVFWKPYPVQRYLLGLVGGAMFFVFSFMPYCLALNLRGNCL